MERSRSSELKNYHLPKMWNDVRTFFLKNIVCHFINRVEESKETYLHIFWKLIHCIDIPSEHANKIFELKKPEN